MRTLALALFTFILGIGLGLAIDQASARASSQSQQDAARRIQRTICLDHVAELKTNGATLYGLATSCRVIATLPESLLSDRDIDLIDAMVSQVKTIASVSDDASGVDVKLDALVSETSREFRKNRADFCSRHPDMSVFDLNAGNDEISAHPCTAGHARYYKAERLPRNNGTKT